MIIKCKNCGDKVDDSDTGEMGLCWQCADAEAETTPTERVYDRMG